MDLDQDGHVDLLSGSWPGELFFFRGGPRGSFAAPEMLRDAGGEIINVGAGVRETDDMLLVTGSAEFERDEQGRSAVRFRGELLRAPEGKSIGITGCATVVHACDWDGDGDLDLLVGDIDGKVHLLPNEATADEPLAFGEATALTAGGRVLEAPGRDAGPVAADWDGDGDLDLIVGCGDGSVQLYRNGGSATAPRLVGAVELVPRGEVGYGDDVPLEPVRGKRAKVEVVDWNLDGRPDLLVGDYAKQRHDPSRYTGEERAEHRRLREQANAARDRYLQLAREELPDDATAEQRAAHDEELNAARDAWQRLRGKAPEEVATHGWVWLFLARPAGE